MAGEFGNRAVTRIADGKIVIAMGHHAKAL